MKMKFLLILTTLITISINAQEITDQQQLVYANNILNKHIKKQLTNEKPQPSEYKSARKLFSYDIDDDGDNDLIAFYTLEGFGGGNNWQHYISIFILSNSEVKVADNLELFGDSWKKYNDGELIEFKNGYVYYKLYGSDPDTGDRIIKTVGITINRNKIVTTKPL